MKHTFLLPTLPAADTLRKYLAVLLILSSPYLALQSAKAAASDDAGVTRLLILSGEANMLGLDPEETLLPTLEAAFPKDRFVVVKDAENGQPLRRWFAREEPRDLYARLMEKVQEAREQETFASTTFLWMQGESDATWAEDSGRYETHMRALIQQLRNDLNDGSVTAVIGRIGKAFFDTNHGSAVRDAQVGVAETDHLVEWVDTDDLDHSTDGAHFTKDARATLGERFAEKVTALIQSQSGD